MSESLTAKIQAANTELIVRGNLDAIGEFFSPDYVVHLAGQDIRRGHEAIRQVLGMIRRSFPDLECEVEILVEEKERVAWLRTLRGVQNAAFKGFPARGNQIVWRDMVTSQFQDGLIAEEWVVTDLAEHLLLAQKKK